MKILKFTIITFFALLFVQAKAQNAPTGNWLIQDGEEIGKYYFFKHNQKLYGLLCYYKEAKEEFSLIKELENKTSYTSIQDIPKSYILSNLKEYIEFDAFEFDDDLWEGTYTYKEDGETKKIDTELKLLTPQKIEAKFTSWGFSETSILVKIE